MMMSPPPFVWITNTSSIPHSDKYAGTILSFKPGEPVLLPLDVAQVCFGYGEKDKGRCLLRLGWLRINDSTNTEQALARLAQFSIEEAVYALPDSAQDLRQLKGGSRPDSAQGGSGKTSKTA